MTAPLVLLALATVLAIGAPCVMCRVSWMHRTPALGILVWQTLSAAFLVATLLAGLTLALPSLTVATDLAGWIGACTFALRHHYSTLGGAGAAVSGGVFAALLMCRLAWSLAAQHADVVHRRRRLCDRLKMIATTRTDDVLVIDHARPDVYCVPGRRPLLVVSTGAVRLLRVEHLDAALAHERAHLAERHGGVLSVAAALRRGFGFLPLFRVAEAEIARLVEMRADDVALQRIDRRTLAAALVDLAGAHHPVGALAAGGSLVLARVRRLAESGAHWSRFRSAAVLSACVLVLAFPLGIAAVPAVAAMAMDYCPLILSS